MNKVRFTPKQQMPDGPAEAEDEISLKEIVGVLVPQLLARKFLIIFVTLIGSGIGFFHGQTLHDTFRSTAVVQIERQPSGEAEIPPELMGGTFRPGSDTPGFATETHIIQSRLVLGPVVERLALDNRVNQPSAPGIGAILERRRLPIIDRFIPPRYARHNDRLQIDRFDLPSDPSITRVQLVSTGDGEFTVSLPEGTEVRGRVGETLTIAGDGTLRLTALQADAGREFWLSKIPLHRAVASTRDSLRVRARTGTSIVDFNITHSDAAMAQSIVNAVVASYQEQSLLRRSSAIDNTIEFIEEQIPKIRQSIEEASAELARFTRDRPLQDLTLGTREAISRIIQFETRLEEIEFRKAELLERVTVNHPDYVVLTREEAEIRGRLSALREDMSSLPEAEQELARLTQQSERTRQLERSLFTRLEELRLQRASAVGNIRVLEPAEHASRISPDRNMPALIGAASGAIFIISGILLFNFFRRGIEGAREIEELGLTLHATVSKVPALVRAKPKDPIYGLALYRPRDVVIEALRGLRTGLRFSLAASDNNILMITSCAPEDGKSFISLNLAIVSGRAGQKVLLIEADMRRGGLRHYFGLDRRASGLSDVLSGTASDRECIYRNEDASVDFMPTGAFPPNPSELLETTVFAELLRYLSQEYDLIIIDAPPVMAVTDPTIIGQHVGMSLLVVRHLVTSKTDIESVQKILAQTGVHLNGCILNQFDQKKSRYGAYGAKYGYHYGGYAYKYD